MIFYSVKLIVLRRGMIGAKHKEGNTNYYSKKQNCVNNQKLVA